MRFLRRPTALAGWPGLDRSDSVVIDYELLRNRLIGGVLQVASLIDTAHEEHPDDDDFTAACVAQDVAGVSKGEPQPWGEPRPRDWPGLWDSILNPASRELVPNERLFAGFYDELPRPIGKIGGSSFHMLARNVICDVYFGILHAADPGTDWWRVVVAEDPRPQWLPLAKSWPKIRDYLRGLPSFDAKWLCDRITDESAKAEREEHGSDQSGTTPQVAAGGIHEAESKNGPVGPDGFSWKGALYERLPPTPWRLLDHLWSTPIRATEFDDLAGPVWRDHVAVVSKDQVASARKTINHFFRRHGIPFCIEIANGYVKLTEVK